MSICPNNTMAAFRDLLAHPIQLEGDWRVALAGIIFPTSIKNITPKRLIHLQSKHASKKVSKADSGGFQVCRE